MTYKSLYDHCQGLKAPIGRNDVIPKVEELCGKKIKYIRAAMDTNILLGLFLTPENPDHPFFKSTGGGSVIVIPRGLERPWERFVLFKEMMHMFDGDLQKTNSSEEFEHLLTGMCAIDIAGKHLSPQVMSEYACMLMAVGALCPEKTRAELKQQRDEAKITDSAIAKLLRVPEKFVPFFFAPQYKEAISFLTDE